MNTNPNAKTGRKTNGVKIYSLSTIALFGLVMLMTRLSGVPSVPGESTSPIDPVTDGSSLHETQPDTSEPFDGEPAVSDPDETDLLPEDDYYIQPDPKPMDDDADNTWAMFLVNAKNPVSSSYSDNIETEKVYESWREYYMDERAAKYMKQMLRDADEELCGDEEEDGVQLIVMSAYRSVEYQKDNFENSIKERMDNRGMSYDEAYADTLKEVQLPGYSEHNAGVAADIMSDEYRDMTDDGFKNTRAYEWLIENAPDYGFILRYPEGKESVTGIIYEPWHFRFVGKYYARYITDRGITLEEFFEEMNWTDRDGKAVYNTLD